VWPNFHVIQNRVQRRAAVNMVNEVSDFRKGDEFTDWRLSPYSFTQQERGLKNYALDFLAPSHTRFFSLESEHIVWLIRKMLLLLLSLININISKL
jgi:hypothetical protein